jgi:hypothetical protein
MVYTCGTMGKHSRRMLKQARRLTRPTPARQDAPFRGQGRSERPEIVLPGSFVYGILRMTRMSPPLRAALSPAHPLARRDVPVAQARALQFSHFSLEGNSQTVLHCAHRTSTVSSCAFCEQEGWSGDSLSYPSEAARCASTEDHQVPSPLLLCEQEGHLAAPSPTELARSLSQERHPYWSYCGRRARPFLGRALREQRTNAGAVPISPLLLRHMVR